MRSDTEGVRERGGYKYEGKEGGKQEDRERGR